MAGIRDWSTTAASNLTVGGISIAEGMNPGPVNDAMRAIMADVAAFAALIADGTQSGTVGGTVDAITLTLSPAETAYAVNQRFLVKATGANTVTTPTLNVSGLGAKTIKLPGGGAVVASQWTTNGMLLLAYDGTDMILLTPTPINTALFAALASANIFTATQTVTSTDAGATEGPILDLHRDSASPLAADLISALYFSGESSTSAKLQYAKIIASILDPTNASEDAELLVQTIVAGALATRLRVGQGLLIEGATGGDPGAGGVNAALYELNGTALPITKTFVSANQTITAAGSLTIAHGLGVEPKLVQLALVAQATSAGFSSGDVVIMNMFHTDASGYGCSCWVDATNINVRWGNGGIQLHHKTTGVPTTVTEADWRGRFSAWA